VRGWYEEGVAAARRAGDAHALAYALAGLGLALGPDESAPARAVLGESLALFRETGDAWFSSVAMNALAGVARAAGAPAEARPLYEAALAIRRAAGDRHGAAIVLHNLGQAALLAGDPARAGACFREGLALARAVGDRHCLAWGLEGLAEATAAQGQPARAALLLGAAAPHLTAGTTSLHPADPAARQWTLATVRRALGGASFVAAWAEGQALSVAQAADLALTAGAGGPAAEGGLSPREREVAALVAQGLTNRQIAARLVVTERTAATHVEHILGKLALTSRVQIGLWAAAHGLVPPTPRPEDRVREGGTGGVMRGATDRARLIG
jgi:non-specific serine/threonine protein kinase